MTGISTKEGRWDREQHEQNRELSKVPDGRNKILGK